VETLSVHPILDFAIALFIGALVGIEREKKMETERERGIGGIRTFILFAQAGAVGAWLSQRMETPWIFVGTGLLVTAIVVAGYVSYAREHHDFGVTTEIAALVVYLLGGTTLFGYPELAVALAITTSAVLAYKEPLHGVVERLGRDDIYAALKLLIATFIVLPVLPDRTLDPWGALNPYKMWWLVILISGLSLVGYVATRWLGPDRGIALTGLFGGLVSSTAVTLALSRRSREHDAGPRLAEALAAGILVSWTVMFARIGVITGALAPGLVRQLAVPLIAMGVIALGSAAWFQRRAAGSPGAKDDVPLRNPFSLTAAIRFAAVFAAVLLVVAIAERYAPPQALFGVAALAGLTDVDAISLSMATQARADTVAIGVAAAAIVIAALSNTLVKFGMAWTLGAPALRRPLAIATGSLVVAGVASLVLRV
jgi:uncharacterized membrane protein (DUF4010 family)